MDAGKPANRPINDNQHSARGIAGRATDRLRLASSFLNQLTIDFDFSQTRQKLEVNS